MLTSIKSVVSYVPSGILTNADLEKIVETSDTWIRERTGIHERRIAAVNETATDLAAEAARDALRVAGLRPQDTDLIVCSTSTPDSMFPSVASRVQERLGAHGPAFDVQAACTGFLYAMSVADRFVSGGEAKQAIVIGSETLTKIINFKDRGTCVVFGDGAGAVVLGPGVNGAGRRFGLSGDVMVNGIASYGNTSPASIPLALQDALAAGRLQTGDHLVLVGFGAGLTWGACVLEWEGAPVRVAA